MIIYKTTNLINGKIYIGKDCLNNINYLGSGLNLVKAFKKYGKENFKKEILQECYSKEELNEAEKIWIKNLNSRNPNIGYNISLGGHGGKQPPEITLKQIQTQTGKRWVYNVITNKSTLIRAEELQKYLNEGYLLGRNLSESSKKLISDKNKNRSEEILWKIGSANRGKHLTEETRKKLSVAETGEKNHFYGKHHTKETIEKIRLKNLGRNKGEKNASKRLDVREKISKAKLGLLNSNSNIWKLISPFGEEYIINGGIVRELKKYNLNYQQFKRYTDIRKNKTGWSLIKYNKE